MLVRVTATAAVAPNSGASTAAAPAARVRLRVRDPLATCLIALAVVLAGPVAHPAQPPGDAAAELAASGRLDAALTLLDGWLAEHPGDERLFPVVLQVATAAPDKRTVDAVLGRYGGALAAENVGVLRAVPADWAELRGGVEQALDELRRSRLPDAGRRQAVLLLELGRFGNETMPREAPIAVHAGLARGGEGIDDPALEDSLRRAFAAAGLADGGADGAVAGYGLVTLLSAIGRSAQAASVLAELGRRYPRSPEYALAAAELRGGHLAGGVAPPPVVALPSPAMLLGSATLVCPTPCSIPVAVLPQPAAPAAPPRQAAPAAPPRQAAPAAPPRQAAPAAPPRQAAPAAPPRQAAPAAPPRQAAPAAPPRQAAPAAPPRQAAAAPPRQAAPAAPPRQAAPAAPPRQAAPVVEATRSPPAAAPAADRRPDRVVLVPATVPATAAAPRQRADSVPVASSAVPAATTDDSRRRAAAPAAAVRSSPAARSTVKEATRAGGTAAAPVAAPAPSAAAAVAAADRALAAAQAGPAPAATSRPARATTPRLEAGSGVTIRAQAAPGHPAAAAARAPAPAAGKLIRVSAQPATRARLSTDRVFVAAESRAGSGARSQPVRTSAVAAGAVAARAATAGAASPAPAAPRSSGVRVASAPDPAAFAVQVGAYIDADNALEMELKLRQAGFPAIARSYRNADGSIVHRVGVGGNVTRAKGEQVLARLSDTGFDAYISRRDVVSYLPPAPRRR